MKVGIIYFSGTGGTAKIAQILGSELESYTHDVDYLRIKKNIRLELHKYDLIGIGSPAYSFRAPRMVTQKLKQLSFANIPYFVFCTSGGMPGNTLWNLYNSVKKQSSLFLGHLTETITTNLRSWMPRKSPSNSNLSYTSPLYQKACKEFIFHLLSKIEDPNLSTPSPRRNWVNSLWSIFFTWRWQMAATVGIKHLNKRKCNQCAICVQQICPSEAIQLKSNGYPRFNEWKCVGCNGCINLCPQDAIWSYQVRNHMQYTPFRKYIIQNR